MVTLVLTHGAGSNRNAPLLVAIERVLAENAIQVIRYDLPFRQARPTGPPRPSDAAADQAGLRQQVDAARSQGGAVWIGGVSYGGRQASMLTATAPTLVDGLLLLSYPLHPPGKPAQLRTAHLPQIRASTLVIQGAKDPFGSPEEIRAALELLPAKKHLVILPGAGHELGKDKTASARIIAQEFLGFLPSPAS